MELDGNGEIVRKNKLPCLRSPPHDFVSAGPFLIFVDSPVKVDALPALVGIRALSDQIRWDGRGRTLIHVVDKESLEPIVTGAAPAFSSAHFAGGRLDAEGTLSFIAFIPDVDDPGGEAMGRFMRGERVDVGGRPTLIAIDPCTGDVVRRQRLADVHAEWPVEDPREAGEGSTVWCATRTGGAGYFDGYARPDRARGIVDRIDLPPGTWGNEPALCVDADDPHKRWLTTVQYASSVDRSELVIYDADALSQGPVARLALPSVVPFGFHGSFVPAP